MLLQPIPLQNCQANTKELPAKSLHVESVSLEGNFTKILSFLQRKCERIVLLGARIACREGWQVGRRCSGVTRAASKFFHLLVLCQTPERTTILQAILNTVPFKIGLGLYGKEGPGSLELLLPGSTIDSQWYKNLLEKVLEVNMQIYLGKTRPQR